MKIIAWGASSPLGDGGAAVAVPDVGEPAPNAVARDEELVRAGLARPFVARAKVEQRERDRATELLVRALEACTSDLDEVYPGWRTMRVGAAIGTSSGGMRTFESMFRDEQRGTPLAATYIGPFAEAPRVCAFSPVSLVLGACASSTLALGLGRAWLLSDRCDVVLCGGFDAVSVFVAAGFECLRATCGEKGPTPFREGREGLSLGEGAVVIAITRPEARPAARAWIHGFGATCDAAHLTAPERSGEGLARAARLAMRGTPVNLVSAHGTATAHNDAAEANAIRAAVGDERVPVFSFKGTIGHTLGAAGGLELLAAIDGMDRGIAPSTRGEGATCAHVLDRSEAVPSSIDVALKLSSAFGGANAALVVGKRRADDEESPGVRDAYLSRAVAVGREETDPAALASRSGYPADRLARGDDLVRLTIAAIAKLEDSLGGRGTVRDAGLIVGHGLATIETNAKFLARIVEAGGAKGEPRRFPYTSPNAAAGEASVAFGLTGPSFAVGGGPHGGIEAVSVAADLVQTGAADRIVVVAVDEAGPASERIAPNTRTGAVALLVTLAKTGAVARLTRRISQLDARGDLPSSAERLPPMDAHSALLPLVHGQPTELHAEIPWGGFAKLALFWL